MTIYEQIKTICANKVNKVIKPIDIRNELLYKYGTNPGSVILSDYCYNRYNKGINFDKHLFHYINRGAYKYLGENYPYTGLIFSKAKGAEKEIVVGKWKNGRKINNNNIIRKSDDIVFIQNEQLQKLYEDYNQILQYEMKMLDCTPTELRHLIGRIGEFLCAIETNGKLARETNQHGFDVIDCDGKRISVKTTAQKTGFISVNQTTFNKFDDLYVVQYIDDEFKVIYYGPKDAIHSISRVYDSRYEIDISGLKKMNEKI